MDAVYQMLGAMLGYLVAVFARYLQRSRFWRRVEGDAQRLLDDPGIPIDDPRDAAEAALADAQRSQLSAIERSISRGGNGFKPEPG